MPPARRNSFATQATFTGATTAGVPTPVVQSFPTFDGDGNATFDASWTGVTSVTITTTGGSLYTLFLFAIYYGAL